MMPLGQWPGKAGGGDDPEPGNLLVRKSNHYFCADRRDERVKNSSWPIPFPAGERNFCSPPALTPSLALGVSISYTTGKGGSVNAEQ